MIRKEVGILYVNGEIEKAKQVGIKWASEHLPHMYTQYQTLLKENDELALFCSRGGMRSSSIFSLLKSLGLPVSRIKGGYKAYRRYVNENLAKQLSHGRFITLYGLSGTGKTAILKAIEQKGYNILDLEGCANHRGSLLGSVGLSAPHSQKMFESLLFEKSSHWEQDTLVFTEGESKRIGKVVMPECLYKQIQQGRKIYIEASLESRVSQIYQDYIACTTPTELVASLDKLNKVINQEHIAKMQNELRNKKFENVISWLLLSYYDPRYKYHKKEYEISFTNQSPEETAETIINWSKQ